jgi:uncharacterized repeat protein (TIGR03803 family)
MIKRNWGMRACGGLLLWAGVAAALPAQSFKTIYSFCTQTNCTDGSEPQAGLVQGANGNLYGTTVYGGTGSCQSVGCGTVFEITSGGVLTTLHSFEKAHGEYAYAGLVQGTNGDFYGTTYSGGANGEGTLYRITVSGMLKTLYTFCAQTNCTDGATPSAGLVQGTNGNFYGTTEYGGDNGDGTVFKITPSGMLTTLYSFCAQTNCTDGLYPEAALVQGSNGKFYGTTTEGGANGEGTLYRITASGTLKTVHNFAGYPTDGETPQAALVQGTDGNFYGTAKIGGAQSDGTVFRVTPSGELMTLHSFAGYPTDGENPVAGLVQGTDGNFYGTTEGGGANNESCPSGCGTIFSITPSGTLTTLYNFCSQGGGNCTDGYFPEATLVQNTDGTFYGTTLEGGARGYGTVFSLSVGLGPFVKTLPTSGGAGAVVTILGTNLTGATSVTFNGTVATFNVVSASEITTTVPAGATTGTVQVVTPGGTLLSNLPFTVTP